MRKWQVLKRPIMAILITLLALSLLVPLAVRPPAVFAQAEPSPVLDLTISGTARVVDHDDGIYVVGTTSGELYVVNEAGEYTSTQLAAGSINDVRIEFPFIAVAAGYTVIELSLDGLEPQELWRITRPGSVVSTDLSEDGDYVAYLSYYHSVGIIADGSIIDSYSISGSYAAHWLDATRDMEFIAITTEPPPYPGTKTGVELYGFNGTTISRHWGRVLVYDYETTEVRVSEAKDYVAVATSSGTIMNLLDLPTGDVLWEYDAVTQEQFACDGDDNLNYVIGGTQAWSAPYRWFVLKNLETDYDLLDEGNMEGRVNDLDATPDGSYFAFGSDAGEVVVLERTDDTLETVFTLSGLPLIDAIEIGSDTLLVGGNGFINLYEFQATGILLIYSEEDTLGPDWGTGLHKRPRRWLHILALDVADPANQYDTFDNRVASITAQGGIAIVAHPIFGATPRDYVTGSQDYRAIEVYNAKAWPEKFYEDQWNDVLDKRAPDDAVWGIATDDAHNEQDYDKAWIMVQASSLNKDAILAAIDNGNFYAVKGPCEDSEIIEGIRVSPDGKTITVDLSREMEAFVYTGEWTLDDDGIPVRATYRLPSSSTHELTVEGDEDWLRFRFNVPGDRIRLNESVVWTQPFLVGVDGVENPYEQDSGSWYKGQLHCHTTGSDADWEGWEDWEEGEETDLWIPTPENVIQQYIDKGYHFLAITDHNRITIPGQLTMTTSLDLTSRGFWQSVTVKVTDWTGQPVSRINVSGRWEWDGKTQQEDRKHTADDGKVVFHLREKVLPWQARTFGFVLEEVSRPAWEWVGGDSSGLWIVRGRFA